jgi:hypothetical protein
MDRAQLAEGEPAGRDEDGLGHRSVPRRAV